MRLTNVPILQYYNMNGNISIYVGISRKKKVSHKWFHVAILDANYATISRRACCSGRNGASSRCDFLVRTKSQTTSKVFNFIRMILWWVEVGDSSRRSQDHDERTVQSGKRGKTVDTRETQGTFLPLVPAFSVLRACQEVNDSRQNAARTDLKGPFETRSIVSGYVSRRPHATNDAKIDAPYCPAFQYAAIKRKEIWSHICTRLCACTCVNTCICIFMYIYI